MERLTKYEPCEGGIPLVTVEDEQSALQRLAAYEDAEEHGRLVMLPCKVGDICYKHLTCCGINSVYEDAFRLTDIPYIGTRVFATREEAEAALAKDTNVPDKEG